MTMTRQLALTVALPVLFLTLGVHARVDKFEIGKAYKLDRGSVTVSDGVLSYDLNEDEMFVCSKVNPLWIQVEDPDPRDSDHGITKEFRAGTITEKTLKRRSSKYLGKERPQWMKTAIQMVRADASTQDYFIRDGVDVTDDTYNDNYKGKRAVIISVEQGATVKTLYAIKPDGNPVVNDVSKDRLSGHRPWCTSDHWTRPLKGGSTQDFYLGERVRVKLSSKHPRRGKPGTIIEITRYSAFIAYKVKFTFKGGTTVGTFKDPNMLEFISSPSNANSRR